MCSERMFACSHVRLLAYSRIRVFPHHPIRDVTQLYSRVKQKKKNSMPLRANFQNSGEPIQSDLIANPARHGRPCQRASWLQSLARVESNSLTLTQIERLNAGLGDLACCSKVACLRGRKDDVYL